MPFDRSRYGKTWPATSAAIVERSGGQCECSGECGKHAERCAARQYEPHPVTAGRVVLTVAHLDHDPRPDDHNPARLRAMCQRCHNSYDQPLRQANARATRQRKKEAFQPRLPGVD